MAAGRKRRPTADSRFPHHASKQNVLGAVSPTGCSCRCTRGRGKIATRCRRLTDADARTHPVPSPSDPPTQPHARRLHQQPNPLSRFCHKKKKTAKKHAEFPPHQASHHKIINTRRRKDTRIPRTTAPDRALDETPTHPPRETSRPARARGRGSASTQAGQTGRRGRPSPHRCRRTRPGEPLRRWPPVRRKR